MTRLRAARMLIPAAAVLGCAVACGGAQATPATQAAPASPAAVAAAVPKPAATQALATSARLQLPIAAYELTETEDAQVDYLSELYTQRCMNAFGFSYLPTLSPSSVARNVKITEELDSRRYGVSDAASAAAYGYDMPAWFGKPTKAVSAASLPQAEQGVLDGQNTGDYDGQPVPSGGCVGQASIKLSAAGIGLDAQSEGVSSAVQLTQQISDQGFLKAQSDQRVVAAEARWAACMRAYGDDQFSTPEKAALAWNISKPASKAEIQVAVHDVTCKQKTDFVGVEFAVESDYENADIARNAQALAPAKAEIAADAAGIQHLMATVSS